MTPTEQWIFCLALVYAVPSFFSGIGVTLLFVRRREIWSAMAMLPRFLSPELAFKRSHFSAPGFAPADKIKR